MEKRTYTELSRLSSFEERFRYLKLHGKVGVDTFGFDRIFNQMFYHSGEWKKIKDRIIARDLGRDLGVEGYEIEYEPILIHHMNPITIDDIRNSTEYLLDPEYLICTTSATHRAIHYGTEDFLRQKVLVERKKNDTCPWRQ